MASKISSNRFLHFTFIMAIMTVVFVCLFSFEETYRVTTFLENLVKSANFAAVRETLGNWPFVGGMSGKYPVRENCF